MAKVIVKIVGGCVQEVIHNIEGLEVQILDGDIEDDMDNLVEFEGDEYYGYMGEVDTFDPSRIKLFEEPYSFSDVSNNPKRYPVFLRDIITKINQMQENGTLDASYLNRAIELSEGIGWTFDYGLDLIPYGLKKIK